VPFRIRLSRQAQRYLERADADTKRRLAAVLDEMTRNPFRGDVRPLRGRSGDWRRRVEVFVFSTELTTRPSSLTSQRLVLEAMCTSLDSHAICWAYCLTHK